MKNTLIFAVLATYLHIYGVAKCSCPLCTNIDHFSHIIRRDIALHSTFKIFKDYGFLCCVQLCLFRVRCTSINFDVSTMICDLNQASANEPSVQFGSICSDIQKWPKRLSLQCENHRCQRNSSCTIQVNTITCIPDDVSPLDKGYTKASILFFYYKMYEQREPYSKARSICSDDGGRLMEPKSAHKNTYIRDVINGRTRNQTSTPTPNTGLPVVYFGATYIATENGWRWEASNTELEFTDWASEEPYVNTNYEPCAAFWGDFDWKWNAVSCTEDHSFICEIPSA